MTNGFGISAYTGVQAYQQTGKTYQSGKNDLRGSEGKLSSKAKSYLDGLRKSHGDTDFIVADDGDDKKGLVKSSNKEFTVVYSSADVERMAKDRKFAAEKLRSVDTVKHMNSRIMDQYGFTSAWGKADKVQTTTFNPISKTSSLVPQIKDGYGYTIGDVQLSDKAKDYYKELKGKFGNAEFILVSKDMKSQVQANAGAYGNKDKLVVLIDDEKLERMANDESYRKKYEGIIAMSSNQISSVNSKLSSKKDLIKSFGMSVGEDGETSFFATVKKQGDDQAKRIEKQQAAKKDKKAAEMKKADKAAREERLKKARDKKSEDREKLKDSDDIEDVDDEYVQIKANSMEELISKVARYTHSEDAVMTEAERSVGQNLDFRG